jgi:hypothetical protein
MLVYNWYTIQRVLKSDTSVPDALAESLLHAVASIDNCVTECLQSICNEKSRPEDGKWPDMLEVSRAMIRAFALVTTGLSVLSRSIGMSSSLCLDNVVYSCSALLVCIWKSICSSQNSTSTSTSGTNSTKSSRSWAEATAQDRLFINLLACLHPECPASRKVFESIFRTMLDHAAVLIYEIEFGHVRPGSIWEDISLDVETHSARPEQPKDNEVIAKAKAVSRRIFPVFQYTYLLSNDFLQPTATPEGRNPPVRLSRIAKRSRTRKDMTSSMKASKTISPESTLVLQKTLVHCLRTSVGVEIEDGKDIFHCVPAPQTFPPCPPSTTD